MIDNAIQIKGDVEIILEHADGRREILDYSNKVLLNGRRTMAKTLANILGQKFEYYVTRMVFGDGGTQNGVKRYVDVGRNGLFGVTRLSKPVIANVDNSIPTQVIFTSVISFDEANGITLNEMALVLANGDLYSMTTFPDLNKTEEIQITFNWRLNFI